MNGFKQSGLIAACLLATACGGGGGAQGNAAEGRTFTYGAPTPATATETQALDAQLALAASLQGQPDASGATALADFSAISGALLGEGAVVARLASPQVTARLSGSLAAVPVVDGYDNPACLTATATRVTLAGCSVTVVDVDTTVTTVVSGFLEVPAPGSLAWDLTARVTMAAPDVSMTATAHHSGAWTVTDTTVKGAQRAEIGVTARAQGQTVSAGMHESLDVDVTVDPGPPACVTGGTLEVKRVWTQRPQGATAADLPDGAAKVTWTGCGTGTVAFSR
jgi:hypothetical protein